MSGAIGPILGGNAFINAGAFFDGASRTIATTFGISTLAQLQASAQFGFVATNPNYGFVFTLTVAATVSASNVVTFASFGLAPFQTQLFTAASGTVPGGTTVSSVSVATNPLITVTLSNNVSITAGTVCTFTIPNTGTYGVANLQNDWAVVSAVLRTAASSSSNSAFVLPPGKAQMGAHELVWPASNYGYGTGGNSSFSLYGQSMAGTLLFWATDAGAGRFAIRPDVVSINQTTTFFGDFSCQQSTAGITLGTPPAYMQGILHISDMVLSRVAVSGMWCGRYYYGDHQIDYSCKFNGNYYGDYLGSTQADAGNQVSYSTSIGGCALAMHGIAWNGGYANAQWYSTTGGNTPYGWYKEAAPAGQTGNGIWNQCTLDSCAHEACGNAGVYSVDAAAGKAGGEVVATTFRGNTNFGLINEAGGTYQYGALPPALFVVSSWQAKHLGPECAMGQVSDLTGALKYTSLWKIAVGSMNNTDLGNSPFLTNVLGALSSSVSLVVGTIGDAGVVAEMPGTKIRFLHWAGAGSATANQTVTGYDPNKCTAPASGKAVIGVAYAGSNGAAAFPVVIDGFCYINTDGSTLNRENPVYLKAGTAAQISSTGSVMAGVCAAGGTNPLLVNFSRPQQPVP